MKQKLKDSFLYAFQRSMPIMIGYFALGSANGILMAQKGYSVGLTGIASLFIYAGGENEEWATHMIQNLELDPDKAIAMLDVVEPLEEERVEGMEPERGHSHDHGKDCDHDHEDHEEYDEHVWTSPKNAALIVHAVCDKLSQICPADASEYADN